MKRARPIVDYAPKRNKKIKGRGRGRGEKRLNLREEAEKYGVKPRSMRPSERILSWIEFVAWTPVLPTDMLTDILRQANTYLRVDLLMTACQRDYETPNGPNVLEAARCIGLDVYGLFPPNDKNQSFRDWVMKARKYRWSRHLDFHGASRCVRMLFALGVTAWDLMGASRFLNPVYLVAMKSHLRHAIDSLARSGIYACYGFISHPPLLRDKLRAHREYLLDNLKRVRIPLDMRRLIARTIVLGYYRDELESLT